MAVDDVVTVGDSAAYAAHANSRAERLLRVTLHVLVFLLVASAAPRWLLEATAFLLDPNRGYDFRMYYSTALALRDNGAANIYDLNVIRAVAIAHHISPPLQDYPYPPLLAVLLIPVTILPFDSAAILWVIVNLVLWLAVAALLIDLARQVSGPEISAAENANSVNWIRGKQLVLGAAVLFLVLTYDPIGQGISLGQINVLLVFLLLLVPWLMRKGHLSLAGVALGLAIWLKVYPVVLLIYYIARGDWKTVRATLWTVALIAVGMVPVIGLGGVLSTWHVLVNGGGAAQFYHNESLMRVPLWIDVAFGGTPGPLAGVIGYFLCALVAGAFATGMYFVWRRWRTVSHAEASDDSTTLLGYAWALSTMVLAAPLTWEHYDTWLLPPIILCLYFLVFRRVQGWRGIALIAAIVLAYALTMSDLPFGYDGTITFSIGPYLLGQPLRPYFMILRPLGASLIWGVSGYLFLSRTLPADATRRFAVALPSMRRLAAVLLTLLVATVLMRAFIDALWLTLGTPHGS